MPELNLPFTIRGRPIKPVSLVLMNTMLVIGFVSLVDVGVLGDSLWSDVLGGVACVAVGVFGVGWAYNSQRISEWALLLAMFVWGSRFWAIVFVHGWDCIKQEGLYLSFLWVLLAGGSWMLERTDPHGFVRSRGDQWTHR